MKFVKIQPSRFVAGYSLVELLAVIVIISILASIAMKSLGGINSIVRLEQTQQEMDRLAHAIAGDPELVSAGTRPSLGYVGDVGALPPDLDALVSNPGLGTWDGPYLSDDFSTDGSSSRYDKDAWGQPYVYSGGITITSTGGGEGNVTRTIAKSTDDLLYNAVMAVVVDLDFTPPGPINKDSVTLALTYPDGSGSTNTDTQSPAADGFARFDSIPVGQHTLELIYEPTNDTIARVVSISPGEDFYAEIQYHGDVWSYSGGGGGGSLTLRPSGSGSMANLIGSGCASNYQCVDEVTADEGTSYVGRWANTYRTDVYALDNPASPTGTISRVTVFCRARTSNMQGDVMPTVYTGSTEYNGTAQSLTGSYADYSHQWTINPNTGVAWTWSDINGLEAGVRLRGQNGVWPAYCTQVWIEVTYGP